jgi:uncharacterized protein (TIGR04255 family)
MVERVLFDRPPVFEVVFGVQFAGQLSFRSFDGPQIHDVFKSSYPNVAEQTPIARINRALIVSPFSASEGPRARWWFTSEDGHNLIQVQDDKFLKNWRALSVPTNAEYPGYENLKRTFLGDLKAFLEHAKSSGFGDNPIEAIQLNYINLIPFTEDQTERVFLKDYLTFFSLPENHRINGMELTWMHDAAPAEDGTLETFYNTVVTLGEMSGAGRGINLRIEGTTWKVDDLESSFDRLHENIHDYFVKLTTDKLHRKWERQ